ncbi:MAG TPA: HdeD family acid-resistance protein, partial [Candidatus Acidoferrum sp.]|nr:HdeD family acid-resistance protein [Candidatus Acidoferrum sp.]
ELLQSIRKIQGRWGWYLFLGVLLIALGVLAIIYESTATAVSVIVLGALLIVAGVAKLIAMFQSRGAGHVILLLLLGALDIVVGWTLIQYYAAGSLIATLLLAVLFVFTGFYGFVAAMWLQLPNYGWYAVLGLLTIALGVLLWLQWPISAIWFIGFTVGLYLIFGGVTWIAFALKIKPAASATSRPVSTKMST